MTRDILLQVWSQGLCVCIVFFVTLSCFPAIASSIVSVDKGSNDWTGRYNIPSVSLSFYTLIMLQIGLDIRDNFHISSGWSGGAMVLGILPVPGVLLVWIKVGQGPIVLAVGADEFLFFC